ncbi:hypothetical protein B7463_g11857, partial [Scytalidium lignicola]
MVAIRKTPSSHLRLGVDVGGTNTDSVLLDYSQRDSPNRGVIAWFKTPTTPDVTDGIETAVRTVIKEAEVDASFISSLIIGTTHFINAIVEQDERRLEKVGVIRLTAGFSRHVPPFTDFPSPLKDIMCGHFAWVDGGLQIDGSLIAPLDPQQIIDQCVILKEKNIRNIVVCGVYSPIDENYRQEDVVKDIILRELGNVNVVLSHEVANIGFLERENASILNASILTFAKRTVRGFRRAMHRLQLTCPLFLTQNDGTLVDADSAARLPIRTFSSGPTNSMRGAAFLSNIENAKRNDRKSMMVVDIGGTTTDVGVLLPSGFPRQAAAYVDVAGVRINYSMPHVESIGLGGGSIVREENGKVTVGPDSVGYNLISEGLVFGGSVLTSTDVVVASGFADDIGDKTKVANLSTSLLNGAQKRIKRMLENIIDRMKTNPEAVTVLLVGGGCIVAPDQLDGVEKVLRPPFFSVANAVGAAIAKVSGTVDTVENTASRSVVEVVEEIKLKAIARAVSQGAIESSVQIAEVDVMPLQYVANQLRVVIKAAGNLDIIRMKILQAEAENLLDAEEHEVEVGKLKKLKALSEVEAFDIMAYRPKIVNKEWFLSENDLKWIAAGCYVLGCAGGGSPYPEFLQLREMVRQGHNVRVVDPFDLPEEGMVVWGGHMGSPAVSVERLPADEFPEAIRDLNEYMGLKDFAATMNVEIGGGNGLQALIIGSSKYFNKPAVDADLMGRAYPTFHQITTNVYQYEVPPLLPAAISSGDGNTVIMTKAKDDMFIDRSLRAACTEMGSHVGMAAKPCNIKTVQTQAVLGTISLAWRIGRAVALSLTNTRSIADAIIEEVGGPETAKKLFEGKIVSVEKMQFKGHTYGEVVIEPLSDEEEEGTASTFTGSVMIPFKNENLYVQHTSPSGEKTMFATVPDLIAVLDSQNGQALGVPEYRYGLRCFVLGITASPRWTDTQRGLDYGGPKAFGYDNIIYAPLGVYREPRSVIKEFQ